jgi:hypothetical protein
MNCAADGVIVEITIFDGLIEDRGIEGEPRHRKLPNVAAECTARK